MDTIIEVIQTADIKDELSHVPVASMSVRRAELAAFLRFAGGLSTVNGRTIVAAETDQPNIAQRFCAAISELYGYHPLVQSGGGQKKHRYGLRVVDDGEGFARQAGLIAPHSGPMRGLPPQIVGGTVAGNEAAWRGAFLGAGSMTAPGRSATLEVTCPSFEAAMALVGAARRLEINAKAREIRGGDQVVVRDDWAITKLLTRMGAERSQTSWNQQRQQSHHAASDSAHLSWGFGRENQQRAARAAHITAMRVERALQILGRPVPEHLVQAARLRINYPDASLHTLAQLTNPPSTKDAMAGRIRRLLEISDHTAKHNGIPDTHAAIPAKISDP